MTVQASGGAPPVQREYNPGNNPPGERPGERPRGENGPPGGDRPNDFGHSPDYNGDGTISREEASAYSTDSRERTAERREEGKNYRAEVSAATAQNASNNDNKMHKMFGKQSQPVPQPQRPSAS